MKWAHYSSRMVLDNESLEAEGKLDQAKGVTHLATNSKKHRLKMQFETVREIPCGESPFREAVVHASGPRIGSTHREV